jgi:predicted acyltransferase
LRITDIDVGQSAQGDFGMAGTGRLEALDVLRGLAVAGMILVVSPGDWGQAYAQLQHASWNGATLADMVFPTFLFSVGRALGLSFPRQMKTASDRRLFWTRLLRRTALLILLGLFVEATYVWTNAAGAPYPGGLGLAHVRIPGILQRVGLCYGLACVLLIGTARRDPDGMTGINPLAIVGCIVAILISYWLLLIFVPVPGFGPGVLTPNGNLPGFVDRTLFTEPHLWPLGSATAARPATYDPEGLLSTLPATTNVLFGILSAWALRRYPDRALGYIAVAAALLIFAGLALDPLLVINKRIWTSSFAILSSGVSALALAALMVVLRSRGAALVLTPFRVLGGNAVLAFLLSTLMSRLSGVSLLPEGGRLIAPQLWGYHRALDLVPDPQLASLFCAVAVLALVTAVIWPLHQRAIHFRL